jgi:DNA-directed RNA polymerase subunit H (RpoH/RPB5)
MSTCCVTRMTFWSGRDVWRQRKAKQEFLFGWTALERNIFYLNTKCHTRRVMQNHLHICRHVLNTLAYRGYAVSQARENLSKTYNDFLVDKTPLWLPEQMVLPLPPCDGLFGIFDRTATSGDTRATNIYKENVRYWQTKCEKWKAATVLPAGDGPTSETDAWSKSVATQWSPEVLASRIAVFFCFHDKFKIDHYRHYLTFCTELEQPIVEMMVLTNEATPFVKTHNQNLREKMLHLQIFTFGEMLYDPLMHCHVPPIDVISQEEKETLLRQLRCKGGALPRRLETDVIASRLRLTPGCITRVWETTGTHERAPYFRIVV